MENNSTKQGPDFLCIGPEKTGTGWLYANLNLHPQISLPPVKEVRYFWEKVFLPNDSIFQRFTHAHWHYRSLRSNLRRLLSLDVKKVAWLFKFLFFPHSDRWYCSLFSTRYGHVSGDITPLYSLLPESEIQRISHLLPNLKIIILLRNPIDRAWSKAKMNLCQHQQRNFQDVPSKEFFKHFDTTFNELSSYVDLVTHWQKYFSKKRILVLFYDTLAERPEELMKSVLAFLDLEYDSYFFHAGDLNLYNRVYKGLNIDLPSEFAVYLTKLYSNCIKEMCIHNYPYSQVWLESANTILAKEFL